MDIHNNDVDSEVFKENPHATDKELTAAIDKKMEQERLLIYDSNQNKEDRLLVYNLNN